MKYSILIIFTFVTFLPHLNNALFSSSSFKRDTEKIIYLNEKSSQNIRLKSVRTLFSSEYQLLQQKSQKIFWSFKRIYTMPKFINEIQSSNKTNLFTKSKSELSQIEHMISLDAEVQDNLKEKYSIDEEASTFDLIIKNLTYADTGLYKCNLWNQKTLYYYLFVSSPALKPDIDFENKMMPELSDVKIKCLSKNSYPYPNIKWFRNDNEIKINSNGNSINEEKISINYTLVDKETNTIESTLTISNVTSQFHMNNFTCKLVQIQDQIDDMLLKFNESSSTTPYNLDQNYKIEVKINSTKLTDELASKQQFWQTSKPITLNIGFKPIIYIDVHNKNSNSKLYGISMKDRKLSLFNNSDINFVCLHKSNPVQSIKTLWFINGEQQIETDATSKNVFKWSLRSNRFDLNVKFMNLSCEISNTIGKSSFTYEITILNEPIVKCDKQVYDIDESNPLQVNCFTDSSPPVNYVEWRHFVQNTSELYKLVTKSSVLDFKSVKYRENSGFYEYVAQNLMIDSFGTSRTGKSQVRIEVNVRFMPQINVIAKKMAANLSASSHSITCMTMSNPQPKFKWYKNGIQLNVNSTKYTTSGVLVRTKNLYENTLTIHDLEFKNDLNKIYKCEAFNLLGLNKLEVELVPLSKPDKPTELRVLYVDFMTITLAWSSGFDGGFVQNFTIEINDTQFDIDSNGTSNYIQHTKYGPSLLNLTYLNFDTTYSIRLMGKNKIGSSEWSDYLMVKTFDLNKNYQYLLPVFDTLFLNVPKNRFEYTFRNNITNQITNPLVCLKIDALMDEHETYLHFKSCLPFNYLSAQHQYSFDLLNENELSLLGKNRTSISFNTFRASQVKSIRVSTCFQLNPDICTSPPTNAIIDTYNKISHSSLKSDKNKNGDPENYGNNLSILSSNSSIPVALIIGICVCILSLLILLCVTVIYCIRKRNFKLCKSLLSTTTDLNNKPTNDCEKNEKSAFSNTLKIVPANDLLDHRRTMSHTNKSFNVDIASISAPMASTVSMNGSQLTNSSTSELNVLGNTQPNNSHLNSNNSNTNRRAAFAATLTATASNIIGKHTNKISEILVTEDDEKHHVSNFHHFKQQQQLKQQQQDSIDENKSGSDSHPSSNTSSTGVSNCSSIANGCNNVIGPFIYNDFNPFDNGISQIGSTNGLTFIDTFNSGASGASSGSNTDPIAINNSLSSNSTSESSPTYGYNVASGAHQQHHHLINDDHSSNEQNSNLLFIKTAYCNNQNHTTFPPLNIENDFQNRLFQQQRQHLQQSQSPLNNSKSNFNSNTNKKGNQFNATITNSGYLADQHQSESGYSTPSRSKKVVYEVIV